MFTVWKRKKRGEYVNVISWNINILPWTVIEKGTFWEPWVFSARQKYLPASDFAADPSLKTASYKYKQCV